MTVTNKLEDIAINVYMFILLFMLLMMAGAFVFMTVQEFSDAPVQSKCVEHTKARIYEWDGTTQMMYDENC